LKTVAEGLTNARPFKWWSTPARHPKRSPQNCVRSAGKTTTWRTVAKCPG